jgi:CDP-glucose 4,6-dehydratase
MGKIWENVRWNDTSEEATHVYESGLLKLNCDKALFDLKWLPSLDFEKTVHMTVEWYKRFYKSDGEDMYDLSTSQIIEYQKMAEKSGIEWASK